MHWKNDNILLEAGNLTLSRALARDKETVHTYTICLIHCSSVLNIICYFFILGLFPLILVFLKHMAFLGNFFSKVNEVPLGLNI